MKVDEGGVRRLAPFLLASLLLHLAVIITVSGNHLRKPAASSLPLPMAVDYVDSGANRERTEQSRSLRRSAPMQRQITQTRGMVTARTVAPLTLGQDVLRSIPPVTGVAHLTTANTESREMSPVTSRKTATGDGSRCVSGVGSVTGTGHHDGGGPGYGPAGGSSETAGGSEKRRAEYRDILKRIIEAHKQYPFAARRSGREGSCQRRFVINRTGVLKRVEALSSCGYLFLDEAATRAITAVGTFPTLPDDFKGTEEAFTITMTFTLTRQ